MIRPKSTHGIGSFPKPSDRFGHCISAAFDKEEVLSPALHEGFQLILATASEKTEADKVANHTIRINADCVRLKLACCKFGRMGSSHHDGGRTEDANDDPVWAQAEFLAAKDGRTDCSNEQPDGLFPF